MVDLIGIGAIALAFTIILVLAEVERRRRRRGMGLPEIVLNERHPRMVRRHFLDDMNGTLPRREQDWRKSAPEWSDPNYYRRYGR